MLNKSFIPIIIFFGGNRANGMFETFMNKYSAQTPCRLSVLMMFVKGGKLAIMNICRLQTYTCIVSTGLSIL